MRALVIGDLKFRVRRSDQRKTMQITVERDGRLTMTAPSRAEREQLERFAKAKRQWVYEKLALKELLPPPTRREFVSGEGFSYLGRSYRLKVVAKAPVPLKLEAGRFSLRGAEATRGEQAFAKWYVEHAQPWLDARVSEWATRLAVQPAGLTVRDQGYRWGSCGVDGQLYFHWKVIQLPPRLIDYVIVHELVHLKHGDHGPAFWAAVSRAMPDYELRRQRLRELGAVL